MRPLLKLEDVSYSYHTLSGETPALSHLSFSVFPGEFVAVVGPSGCGKSTLLSIIFGLLAPEEGKVLFSSDSSPQCPSDVPGKRVCPPIGYMLQKDHLFEWRTVYQNALLGLEVAHKNTPEAREYVLSLLRDYGLYKFKDKRPCELSGGMKQRAALIRTLALNPDLLLLDEPFSALDYQTRLHVSGDICNIIKSCKKTALLITHDLSEAISLADRVIVLSKRPATVKMEMPVRLTKQDNSLLSARNAPEFKDYFNILWEAMSDEK